MSIASMVASMLDRGVDREVIMLAIETAEECLRGGQSADCPVDATTEKRRAYDRERARERRQKSAESTGLSADIRGLSENHPLTKEDSIKKEKKVRGRASQLSADFEPDWQAASSVGLSKVEGERELEKFKNHAKQNGRTCIDWQAAWRNWCIKAAEFLGKPPPKTNGHAIEMPGFYAAFASPQLEAWEKFERGGGQKYPRDKKGGWRFPTEWPPECHT